MIYLDLDGPMVNWTKGVYKLYGKTPASVEEMMDRGKHSILDDLGVNKGQILSRITKAGAKWWANLEPQPWAKNFYDELSRIDEVMILTSSSNIPAAADGKIQWMKKFFGGNFNQYILTTRKDLLAKSGDVLIDDHDKNVTAFTYAGGIGIIFPRPWNKEAEHSKHALIRVFEKIKMVYPRYTLLDDEEYANWQKMNHKIEY